MANEKITYVMAIDEALKVITNKEVSDKLEALKVSLIKKAGQKKLSDKVVNERAEWKDMVYDALVSLGKASRVMEIISTGTLPTEASTSKVTSILKMLVEDGRVEKIADKKATLYKAIVEDVVED